MQLVLKDSFQESLATSSIELAGALLSGLERVKDLIAETLPEQWAGRSRNHTRDHVQIFIERDPIYTALHASLFQYDEFQGSDHAVMFKSNARDTLKRVQKLSEYHHVGTDDLQNIERAYICILYMNTIEGVENPVLNTFIGDHASTYTELLTEIQRNEINKKRENQVLDLLMVYATQVANLDPNFVPEGAAWLRSLWDTLGPQDAAAGDITDYRSYLAELRPDLESIVDTLNQVERYSNGEQFSIQQEDGLARSLTKLNEKAGLRHLAKNEIVLHLTREGIGNLMALSRLMNIGLVLDKGVEVPKSLRVSAYGQAIIARAAAGDFHDSSRLESDHAQITKRFVLESKIKDDDAFLAAFDKVFGSQFAYHIDTTTKAPLYEFSKLVRELSSNIPLSEILQTSLELLHVGLLNGQTKNILTEYRSPDYPLQGYTFLKNLTELAQNGVLGVRELHSAYTQKIEEQVGVISEAAVAVSLIEAGHTVHALRHIGRNSGHIDYDILATIDEVIYGIEVKSTVEALLQKNSFHSGSDNTASIKAMQLFRLTENALIDGYTPAVICHNMKSIGVLATSLIDTWRELRKFTSGTVTPAIFDKSGRVFGLADLY